MIPQFKTPWLVITGGDVVLPGGDVVPSGTVLINQGIVQAVVDTPPTELLLGSDDVTLVDASGAWVTPGLIDQHLHGAFGVDFNQGSVAEIHELLSVLPQYGITGVLPTLISAPKLELAVALSNMEEVIHTLQRHQARVFGIHLEGPFLNPEFRGAHPAEDLLVPSLPNLEGLVSPSLKRVTLAPEMDKDLGLLKHLVQQGISCSIGHSGADYVTAMDAIHAGARCATHLFNAMGRMAHREPGIAMACLLCDDLFVELIADGKHLSPVTIEMALRLKPFEKAILISDCNALTGMAIGSSMRFGRQTVRIEVDGAVNQEGRLAGSTMLIGDCVRQIARWGLLTFPQAVQMATYHPASHLGETPLFGSLAPGAMADVVLWNHEDLSIRSVYLAGEPVTMTPMQLSSASG